MQHTAADRPVAIVSGGMGASAEQVVRTALAQFEANELPLLIVPHVRNTAELHELVEQIGARQGLIVHTLVDAALRQELIALARERGVAEIDLIGTVLGWLGERLQAAPLGQPGRYRQQHAASFARVEAIEWTLAHDDGRGAAQWSDADVVLVGVSRVAKTPTSIYLAALGWKVANASLAPGVQPPPALFKIDRRRVVGLTIDVVQLAEHRRQRQRRLGIPLGHAYTDPEAMEAELRWARQVMRQGNFGVLDVTARPIEEIADEVLRRIPTR